MRWTVSVVLLVAIASAAAPVRAGNPDVADTDAALYASRLLRDGFLAYWQGDSIAGRASLDQALQLNPSLQREIDLSVLAYLLRMDYIPDALAKLQGIRYREGRTALRGIPWKGTVVAVQDGDTVVVADGAERVPVRIYGCDAPELTQPGGAAAAATATRLMMGVEVMVGPIFEDENGRLVARVTLPIIEDAALALILVGAAWYAPDHGVRWSELPAAQADAKQLRIGLWSSGTPVEPRSFCRNPVNSVAKWQSVGRFAHLSGDDLLTATELAAATNSAEPALPTQSWLVALNDVLDHSNAATSAVDQAFRRSSAQPSSLQQHMIRPLERAAVAAMEEHGLDLSAYRSLPPEFSAAWSAYRLAQRQYAQDAWKLTTAIMSGNLDRIIAGLDRYRASNARSRVLIIQVRKAAEALSAERLNAPDGR